MISETDIAWAAGFFDGEGSIAIQRPTARFARSYHLSIEQKDWEPIERFLHIFGGSPGRRDSSYTNVGVRRNCFVWRSSDMAHSRWVMAQIYPYLTERRQKKWADALEIRKLYEEGRSI